MKELVSGRVERKDPWDMGLGFERGRERSGSKCNERDKIHYPKAPAVTQGGRFHSLVSHVLLPQRESRIPWDIRGALNDCSLQLTIRDVSTFRPGSPHSAQTQESLKV